MPVITLPDGCPSELQFTLVAGRLGIKCPGEPSFGHTRSKRSPKAADAGGCSGAGRVPRGAHGPRASRLHQDRAVCVGGAILASAVGWGAIVAHRVYGNDAWVGWGLEAALGMAVHLALGGLLAMFSLVSVTTCYVAVTLGVVLFAFEARRRAAANAAPTGSAPQAGMGSNDPSIAGGVVILFLGVALLHYLGHAAVRPANIFDDYQAYLVFPKQLLATGTLIEPFLRGESTRMAANPICRCSSWRFLRYRASGCSTTESACWCSPGSPSAGCGSAGPCRSWSACWHCSH